MKILILTVSFLYSLSIQAVMLAPELCEEDPLKDMLEITEYKESGLEMSFDYSLSKDCTYTVSSEVSIPNSESLDQFMKRLLDPAVNLASADRSKVTDMKVTPSGPEFKQIATAKKNGIKAEIISTCKFTAKTDHQAIYVCKTNVDQSKTKGIASFKLFDRNETMISCQSGNPKKCRFITVGKAKSLLTKSSCDLAAPGATETFETTYRLAHYLTYGNVNNIKAGKDVVDRFYLKAKDHTSIGKTNFSLKDDL